MKADMEEVSHLRGTGIVIEITIGNEIDTGSEMVTVKDLERGIAEKLERGLEDQIGSTAVPGMEEIEAGKDTASVTEAGHVLLLDMVTGDHPGVQSVNIEDIGWVFEF